MALSNPWGPVGLAIPALLLILFADRMLSWHATTLSQGREYIWKTRFRQSISDLVCYLDDELGLQQNIEQYRAWAEADPSNPQGRITQYSDDLAEEIPYTGDIRKLTSGIGDNAEQISILENYYHELPDHVRRIGIYLLGIDASWVAWNLVQPEDRVPTLASNIILLLIPILVFIIGWNAYLLNKKQSELRAYSRKFEEIGDL